MKMMFVVVLALVAAASSAAIEEPIKTLRSEFVQQPEGAYQFGFETENGISRQETGEVREAFDEDKKPHKVVVVRGFYTYTNSEGKPETINYSADEFGYQADGPSVPKASVARR